MEIIDYTKNKALPNATTVLVMGILSIVLSCGIGLILGIIGLIQAKPGMRLYRENPQGWENFGSLKAGRIMSIIGICINGLAILYYLFFILIFGAIFGTAAMGSGFGF